MALVSQIEGSKFTLGIVPWRMKLLEPVSSDLKKTCTDGKRVSEKLKFQFLATEINFEVVERVSKFENYV